MCYSVFLREAIRIGDDILSRKIESKNGLYWKTLVSGSSNEIWKVDESIYRGTGGILLFFIELYKQTSDQKYLDVCIKGAEWLVDNAKKNPTSYYEFFSGRMGLTYVLMTIYKITYNEKYKQLALDIAYESVDYIEQSNGVNDLINGTSGTLLGLLILHSETNENRLLPIIDLFVKHLIENVNHGIDGIYWDKNTRQIKGLCGFSHGAAGVGYIFLQLGYYFNNPSFYWIAEQAFAYENYFLDRQNENWPDFRHGIFDEKTFSKHREAYLNQDFVFFYKPSYITYWCHGAPGIGFSRISAWKLLNKKYLKQDYERCIVTTRKETLTPIKDVDTYTLCHGKGGNAMLFIEAYKFLGNEKAFQWAKEVAIQALEYLSLYGYYLSGSNKARKSKDYEDLSLFLGSAGVGYFYLMCEAPKKVPSILSPSVGKICEKDICLPFDTLNIKLPQIQKKILTKAYPGTIKVMTQLHLPEAESFFDLEHSGSADLKSAFENHIRHSIINSDHPESGHVQNVFDMEKKKLELELHANPALLNIKSILLREESQNLLSLSKEYFMQAVLRLNDDVTIVENNDHTPHLSGNQQDSANQQAVVLFCTPQKVEEYRVSSFTQKILEAFAKPKKICEVKDQIFQMLDSNGQMNESKFEELVVDQIKECIRSLFLINPETEIGQNQTSNLK